MVISHLEITRVAVGAILGGVIGYERDRHKRPVGLRTHTLVAMTAATFMIVSTQFVYFQNYKEGELINVDPSRIAASVVSGIGFLAGGAILPLHTQSPALASQCHDPRDRFTHLEASRLFVEC